MKTPRFCDWNLNFPVALLARSAIGQRVCTCTCTPGQLFLWIEHLRPDFPGSESFYSAQRVPNEKKTQSRDEVESPEAAQTPLHTRGGRGGEWPLALWLIAI